MRRSPAHGGELKDLGVDPARPVNPRAARERPYFPGYLFVRAQLSRVGDSAFRWMPYSAGLVQVAGEPAPVPDLALRAIAGRVRAVWQAGGLPEGPTFLSGEQVIVREGLFEGYRAIFDLRLPGSDRARVLLKMLNDRYVPVEIDLASLKKERSPTNSWH